MLLFFKETSKQKEGRRTGWLEPEEREEEGLRQSRGPAGQDSGFYSVNRSICVLGRKPGAIRRWYGWIISFQGSVTVKCMDPGAWVPVPAEPIPVPSYVAAASDAVIFGGSRLLNCKVG